MPEGSRRKPGKANEDQGATQRVVKGYRSANGNAGDHEKPTDALLEPRQLDPLLIYLLKCKTPAP